MAIAYDNSTKATATATSLTFSHTCGSGSNRILFVAVANWQDGDSITGVTYNGTAMTLIDKKVIPGLTSYTYLFYLIAPSTGANNVVVSSSADTIINAIASSYTGAAQTGVPDASATGSKAYPNDGIANGSVTTIADNSWVVMAPFFQDPGTMSAGADTTLRQAQSVEGFADSNAAVTPAGSRTLTVNGNNDNLGWVIASFAPAPVDLTVNVSDQLNVTESVSITKINNISVSDQLNVTESVALSITSQISVSDQLNITESVTMLSVLNLSVSDQINITESTSLAVTPLFISVSDQLTVSESVTTSLFQETLLLSVSDQLDISEQVTMSGQLYLSVADEISISESVQMLQILGISVNDSITISENVQTSGSTSINVNDQINITESVTMVVSQPRKGLAYMRGQDQIQPVDMRQKDYPLGLNDTSIT